ncbi:cold-regulated 413 plasma membrane protein 2 [Quercus suber]|uniref:Cold-regulated 413 plasma membrane protein 2 n=1 Tax=Quercus suber TaxID=58331 RepID=A0AAW0KTQ9_QUESU
METLRVGFAGHTDTVVGNGASSASTESSSSARAWFQWGGTIFAFSGLGDFDVCVEKKWKNAEVEALHNPNDDWAEICFMLQPVSGFLLILNRTGRRSSLQTTLLVLYLVTSFPTALFKILRGQIGCWVAFLAIAANLYFPQTFPVSRFLLFVVTPDWLTDRLRDGIVSGIVCLVIGVSLVITEVRGIGGLGNCQCTFHCFGCCLGIAFLFFFTIRYLCLGTW